MKIQLMTPLLILLCGFTICSYSRAQSPVWPLKVSENGHYLTDSKGTPFLMIADTGWGIKKLSRDEVSHYLDVRKLQGFNTVLVYIQKEIGDLTSPNQAAIDHIKYVASECGARDMLLALNVGWFGLNSVTLLPQFKKLSDRQLIAYGSYLGSEFKDYNNLLFIQGGDANPEKDGSREEILNIVRKICQGLNESKPSILNTYHTTEPDQGSGVWSSSSTWFHDEEYIDLHSSQVHVPGRGYEDLYRLPLQDYNLPHPKPHFMIEPGYEEQSFDQIVTPYFCRMGALWPVLSGSCGISYGHGSVWNFRSDWKSKLDDMGAKHVSYISNLLQQFDWHLLIPDSTNQIITEGFGTWYSKGTGKEKYDYITSAGTSDRSLAIAYVPTRRDFTINLEWFKAAGKRVSMKWYDPSTPSQTYEIEGSPFFTTESITITMPSDNQYGDEDWVLIAKVNGAPYEY